jgi:hypothetical protein
MTPMKVSEEAVPRLPPREPRDLQGRLPPQVTGRVSPSQGPLARLSTGHAGSEQSRTSTGQGRG